MKSKARRSGDGLAINWRALVTTSIVLGGACRPTSNSRVEDSAAPGAVSIRAEPKSAFRVLRSGAAPAFRAQDLSVFVTGTARHLDTGLPGVAIGTERGPMYGLLSGYFAPQWVAANSSTAYGLDIDLREDHLRVRLLDSAGRSTGSVRITPPQQRRVRLTTEGSADLAFVAARTTVRGLHEGRPSFSLQATAGDRPGRRYPRGRRIIVESPRFGPIAIEQGCLRSTLIHPTPRGSTSVFILRVGPDPGPVDPLYAPLEDPVVPADRNDCRSETATITIPWPPPPE